MAKVWGIVLAALMLFAAPTSALAQDAEAETGDGGGLSLNSGARHYMELSEQSMSDARRSFLRYFRDPPPGASEPYLRFNLARWPVGTRSIIEELIRFAGSGGRQLDPEVEEARFRQYRSVLRDTIERQERSLSRTQDEKVREELNSSIDELEDLIDKLGFAAQLLENARYYREEAKKASERDHQQLAVRATPAPDRGQVPPGGPRFDVVALAGFLEAMGGHGLPPPVAGRSASGNAAQYEKTYRTRLRQFVSLLPEIPDELRDNDIFTRILELAALPDDQIPIDYSLIELIDQALSACKKILSEPEEVADRPSVQEENLFSLTLIITGKLAILKGALEGSQRYRGQE